MADATCAEDIEAAHVRTGTPCGMGEKPGDWWTISLCSWHHHVQHTKGEAWFERTFGIDMKALAREFTRKSPDPAMRAGLAREDAQRQAAE